MDGPEPNVTGVLGRGDGNTDTHRGRTTWKTQGTVAVCKPRRKAFRRSNLANPSLLDSSPQKVPFCGLSLRCSSSGAVLGRPQGTNVPPSLELSLK